MSEHKRNKNNRSGNQLLKTGMVWTILLAALVAVFVLSIAIGSSGYPLSEVLRGLWDTEAGKIRIIVFKSSTCNYGGRVSFGSRCYFAGCDA